MKNVMSCTKRSEELRIPCVEWSRLSDDLRDTEEAKGTVTCSPPLSLKSVITSYEGYPSYGFIIWYITQLPGSSTLQKPSLIRKGS